MSKVAIITNIPAPYRVDLYYHLQTHVAEHEFFIIYTSRNEDNRAWDIQEEKLLNTRILESRILKIKNKLDTRYIHLPGNIGKELSSIQPDVVIAEEYNPSALQSMWWAKLHGKTFIHWTDGTLHSERNIGKFQKLTRKIICGNADACLASSTKSKEKLMAWGVPEEKIFFGLLTVDISKYRDLVGEPVPGRLLYVGSMIPRKGLDLLLEALNHVTVPFELHIVGNGTREEISGLKAIAQTNGIADKVVFCGFKQGDALTEEYRKAQVFVLPTREDCFGLVLLEAMCAGVPIVASKYADGAYDVIAEGENGYIADPFQPECFGKAIEKALVTPMSCQAARERKSEAFSFAEVSKGILKAIAYAQR